MNSASVFNRSKHITNQVTKTTDLLPIFEALTEINHIEILQLFGITKALPDSVIESNLQPLFVLDDAIELVMPSYIAWCLKHGHSDGNIAIDGTVSALSEI